MVDQMSSSTSRNSTASGAESTTGSISSTIAKALSAKSEWSDKDEFLDVIYWFRYVVISQGFCLDGFLATHLNWSWRFLSFFGFWLEFFSEFVWSFEHFHQNAFVFFSLRLNKKPS